MSPRLVFALSAAVCWLSDVLRNVHDVECKMFNFEADHIFAICFFHPLKPFSLFSLFFVIALIMCESLLLMEVSFVPAKF